MSTIEYIVWCALVLVGIGGSAFCSGLEVGLYSANRVLARVRGAGKGDPRAIRLQKQLDEPVPALTALLVWNNVFNYVGTLALTTLVATIGLSDTQMVLAQVVVLTPLLLVFAESTPKEVFRANADVLMPRFAPLLVLMRGIVTIIPIVPILSWIAETASRLVGVGKLGSLGDTRERVAELLKFGSGSMSDAQATLIDRALQLEHARVRTEMIPIGQVRALRAGWNIARARSAVRGHPFSRFPVISREGKVVGVVHAIDLYVHKSVRDESQPIEEIMRQPVLIGMGDSVEKALRMLSRSGAHMGIVRHQQRDLGIVTRKDLVEPLVGELEDW
jgi:CBS domain containing-hemolysin-like protein